MARFVIEIETVSATPAEWVDALAKVRGLPEFELSEEPVPRTRVEVAAADVAALALAEAKAILGRLSASRGATAEALVMGADSVKALTCSAYSAMRLVGGAK